MCLYAAAVSLPAVCSRQQHKSHVAKVIKSQMTGKPSTAVPCFSLASSRQMFLLSQIMKKDLSKTDRNGLQCMFWMDRVEVIWHRAQKSRFLWLRNFTYSNNLILHLRIAKCEHKEVKCTRFRVKCLVPGRIGIELVMTTTAWSK